MHPVVIALPAQRYSTFAFHDLPEWLVLLAGERRLGTVPFQLVAVRVEVHRYSIRMHRPASAAAHLALFEAPAVAVQAQVDDALLPVLSQYLLEDATHRVYVLLVTLRIGNALRHVPSKPHFVRKMKRSLVLSRHAEEMANVQLRRPQHRLARRHVIRPRQRLVLVAPR